MSQQAEKSFETEVGNIVIRSFSTHQDEDEVKAMYVSIMKGITFPLYKRQFKFKSAWLILIAGMMLCWWLKPSIHSPLFAVFTTMAIFCIFSIMVIKWYINSRLRSDLKDITNYYINRPRCHFWVADHNGTVVGTVSVQEDEADHTKAELRTLVVKKEYRRFGIGNRLVDTVVDFARARDYEELFLQVFISLEPARKLYEINGFKLLKIRRFNVFVAIKWELCIFSMILKKHL
ncbi:putative N-acetyltransferase family 8 member 5 [Glandiceps talaboti]